MPSLSRRSFLQAGLPLVGGLSLVDLLRLRAGATARRESSPTKAVIYVYLFGGPSHVDTYDMKPDAPAEYRGEFQPVRTNVPGFDICELMPLQTRIADKLALIRNLKFNPNFHDPVELLSGWRKPMESRAAARPDFGCVISKLQSRSGYRELPPYVALDTTVGREFLNGPAYLGAGHRAFIPGGRLESLAMARGITLDRLDDRRTLLQTFDQAQRDVEYEPDPFRAQALQMITSPRARDAFDISREPASVRDPYGDGDARSLLQARRLVEAGVPVVTLTFGVRGNEQAKFSWDTHEDNFKVLRYLLPRLDQAVYALITDIQQRGLQDDVLVVIGGEMGRTPRLGQSTGNGAKPDGRDHWPQAGFSIFSGGGLQMGQVIGRTERRGERAVGAPYTPQNLLASIYRFLGIDLTTTTLPDFTGRPQYLLDDREPVRELF
jgi:hypothetical protein